MSARKQLHIGRICSAFLIGVAIGCAAVSLGWGIVKRSVSGDRRGDAGDVECEYGTINNPHDGLGREVCRDECRLYYLNFVRSGNISDVVGKGMIARTLRVDRVTRAAARTRFFLVGYSDPVVFGGDLLSWVELDSKSGKVSVNSRLSNVHSFEPTKLYTYRKEEGQHILTAQFFSTRTVDSRYFGGGDAWTSDIPVALHIHLVTRTTESENGVSPQESTIALPPTQTNSPTN